MMVLEIGSKWIFCLKTWLGFDYFDAASQQVSVLSLPPEMDKEVRDKIRE